MPGPYDIYTNRNAYSGPKYLPDLSSFFTSPMALGAGLVTDMFLIPRYMSRGSMLRSVNKDLRLGLLDDVRHTTGGVSPRHFKNYMRGYTDHAFMKRTGYGTFGEVFGKRAASRLGMGRLASSFSRFTLLYGVVEGLTALGGMLGDAISAYQPEPYVNKRRQIETGGSFTDTRYAQTQRMRAIQAIHNTQLSTRAALGNEASFMHLER